jgi:CO dehydrogenase/acetyl-CoA synthase gamma subunit (corrinoid Fe-S protein)
MLLTSYHKEIFRPECGQPTCMVFATLAAQGVKDAEDCPALNDDKQRLLQTYLARFGLDV